MIWSLLMRLVARRFIPEPLRKFAAGLLGIVSALALLWLVWTLAGMAYRAWEGHVERRAVAEYKADVERRAAEAALRAANARAADAIRNASTEKELHDAIDKAEKGGVLPPATRALACERLRKRGGELPAACRPGGGNGEQAGPR